MQRIFTLAILIVLHGIAPLSLMAEAHLAKLPVAPHRDLSSARDWLLDDGGYKAGIYRSDDGTAVVIDNGLIRRVIRLTPNAATIGIDDLRTGESLLRSVRPEAEIVVNGRKCKIGGLVGQPNQAYLTPAWVAQLADDPEAFVFTGFEITTPEKPFEWKRVRHAEERPWPPRGVAILLHFQGRDPALAGVKVTVRHEMYDGVPVLVKSMSITNGTEQPLELDSITVEIIAAVEDESAIDSRDPGQWGNPSIDVLSDFMFSVRDRVTANSISHWEVDPTYTTQVSFELQTPCLLECKPPLGPVVPTKAG